MFFGAIQSANHYSKPNNPVMALNISVLQSQFL